MSQSLFGETTISLFRCHSLPSEEEMREVHAIKQYITDLDDSKPYGSHEEPSLVDIIASAAEGGIVIAKKEDGHIHGILMIAPRHEVTMYRRTYGQLIPSLFKYNLCWVQAIITHDKVFQVQSFEYLVKNIKANQQFDFVIIPCITADLCEFLEKKMGAIRIGSISSSYNKVFIYVIQTKDSSPVTDDKGPADNASNPVILDELASVTHGVESLAIKIDEAKKITAQP